jgi:nitroreductase
MIVTDPAKRAAVAAAYRKVGEGYLEQARHRAKDPQTTRVYESAYALTQILERVPLMIIPCLKREFDDANRAVAASAYGSIMPAAWSLLLALRSRGLGSTWTTLHLFDDASVAAALEIPPGVRQIALFPVAYTVGTDFRPAERPPVEQITYWDTWGNADLAPRG